MSNAHNKDGKYRGIIDEIREQQRKMKDMTWKERFAYYWEYYKAVSYTHLTLPTT